MKAVGNTNLSAIVEFADTFCKQNEKKIIIVEVIERLLRL